MMQCLFVHQPNPVIQAKGLFVQVVKNWMPPTSPTASQSFAIAARALLILAGSIVILIRSSQTGHVLKLRSRSPFGNLQIVRNKDACFGQTLTPHDDRSRSPNRFTIDDPVDTWL